MSVRVGSPKTSTWAGLWLLGKTRRYEDRIRNERTREELKIPSMKSVIEHRQPRWYGLFCRMGKERMPNKCMEVKLTGRRPRGRPRRNYMEHVQRLGLERGKTLPQMKTLARGRDDQVVRGSSTLKGTQGV
ncbi:uncharacterized protein [Halyomorpha halys]|uniref:uncharacterized protein n=1 Tax=Halyomorpha halys TaxID=286706 RepID=UPI0034D2CC99